MKSPFNFGISVETNDQTGEIMAVYLRIRDGSSAKTVEHADGNLFADYDRKGRLLGIEILAPCSARILSSLASTKREKAFVKQTVPRGMLLSA
jgi:uncharacterized protein YuzE